MYADISLYPAISGEISFDTAISRVMATQIIFVKNDHILRIDRLRDHNGNYHNDATVQLTAAVDQNSDAVTGLTLPLALAYIASSTGRYEGTWPDTAGITAGDALKLTFVATASDGKKATSVKDVVVETRN